MECPTLENETGNEWVCRIPRRFGILGIDEAHLMKRKKTKPHSAAIAIEAESVLAITGTPMANEASDLGGIFRLIFRNSFEGENVGIPHGDPELYVKAAKQYLDWSKGKSAETSLSDGNMRQFLWLLNPQRWASIADPTRSRSHIDAHTAAKLIPVVFRLCLIKRMKNSAIVVGGSTLRSGEVEPALVRTVELYQTPVESHFYRQIYIQEASGLQTRSPGDDDDSRAFDTRSMRRLVIAASNVALDQFTQKGMISKEIIEDATSKEGVGLGDALAQAYFRATTPAEYLPDYTHNRHLDLEYQLCLSPKKTYVFGMAIKWCMEEDRKLVVFSNWPLVDFDLRVTCSTLGLPFVSVSAQMSAAAREAAVREFSDHNSPVKILFSSLRVGAQSLNLQVATREIIVDYPTNAGISLQAINRVNRIGQTERPEVHILMCANTVDQIVAARTEEKYLPIISGSGDLHASDEEIQEAMEKAKVDKAIWPANYPVYRDRVIEGKAKAIYRRMFGSRCSHLGWKDLNLDLKDYMQDGPYEDKVEQKQEIIKRYDDNIAHSRADHFKAVQSAYRQVAEDNGLSIEELDMMLEHRDTILSVMKGETATRGKAKNARVRAIRPSGGEDVEMLQKSFGDSTSSKSNDGGEEELFHKVNAQKEKSKGKGKAKVVIPDSDEEMMDLGGD